MSTQPMTAEVNPKLIEMIQNGLSRGHYSAQNSLTRSDLATLMESVSTEMSAKEANYATHALIDILSESLIKGSRIEIRGFGTWEIRFLGARTAHNPRTGEKVKTIGKFRPHFKAGKSLKNRVNAFYLKQYDRLKQTTQSETQEKALAEA